MAFEGLYVWVWFCIVWLPYKPHYCRCKAALGQKSHWASSIVTAMGSFLTGIAFIANSAKSSTVTATAAQILLLTPAPPLSRLPSDCPLYSSTCLTFCQLEHQIKVIISFLMLTVLTCWPFSSICCQGCWIDRSFPWLNIELQHHWYPDLIQLNNQLAPRLPN